MLKKKIHSKEMRSANFPEGTKRKAARKTEHLQIE